jgi:hypothetical protein
MQPEFPSGNLIHFLYSSRAQISVKDAADKIQHLGTYKKSTCAEAIWSEIRVDNFA